MEVCGRGARAADGHEIRFALATKHCAQLKRLMDAEPQWSRILRPWRRSRLSRLWMRAYLRKLDYSATEIFEIEVHYSVKRAAAIDHGKPMIQNPCPE